MGKLFRQIEGMLNAERTTVDGAKLLLEVSNFVICCSLHRRIFWLSRATLHVPEQSLPPVVLLKARQRCGKPVRVAIQRQLAAYAMPDGRGRLFQMRRV